MMGLLDGRIALVTGAFQGNGAAIAIGLASHGARVVASDLQQPEQTAAKCSAFGLEAKAMIMNVADAKACDAAAAEIARDVGPVSIVVNNAGVCPRHTIDAPNLRTLWDETLSINLTGALNVVLACLPMLRATRGNVVNITSIASIVATKTSLEYPASKGGLKLLTQGLARELAADGIRVNAIAPGPFRTPMLDETINHPDGRGAAMLSRVPLGRFAEPEELVGPTVFLCSDMSSYVTGATLAVDGGFLAV
jgi:NAD(P)-dependent dehydrogenase (short-subunit alcohol dehydrogenase family)